MFEAGITIKQLIAQASAQLAAISDTQTLDCQILLTQVLDKPNSYLLTWPEKTLNQTQIDAFNALFSRRLAGEPVAYIIGEREFWSLPLSVSPATLIPRPDTETLVELVLNQHPEKGLKCLDLGTGTGAIALALASESPSWVIEGVDFNEEAVDLAKHNQVKCQLPQVTFYQSDWFSQINENSFDIIVSNPPYIDESDPHLAQGDVRFEPLSALVAPEKGFSDIEHIIETARSYFGSNGGWLYLEHGFEQAHGVQTILKRYGYQEIATQKDFGGNPRITYARYAAQ